MAERELSSGARGRPGRLDREKHIGDVVRRLHNMEKVQNRFILEREDVTRAITICLINRSHLLLAGPPGTGKTSQVRLAAAHVKNSSFFVTQLTPFSTVEDVFGPIDLVAYKEGERRRVGEGMLQEAHVAVVDEIYNSNEAVLQSLLAPMYEGMYAERGRFHPIPLRTLMGTTNVIPTAEERLEKGLTGFHDRWLFRFLIEEVRSDSNFMRMLWTPDIDFHTYEPEPDATVTTDELQLVAEETVKVRVPVAVYELLIGLRKQMADLGIMCSLRRWKQIHRALQTAAFLDGRYDVGEQDFAILRHMLWNQEGDIPVLERLLETYVTGAKERAALTFSYILEAFAQFEQQRRSLHHAADVSKLALQSRRAVEQHIATMTELASRTSSAADKLAIDDYLQRAYDCLHDLDGAAGL